MDDATLGAYDRAAAAFADEWETQPPPVDLHAVVRRFLTAGRPTADIGCGSGRDTAWLDRHGYPAQGFDASEGLLAEARRRHPGLTFTRSELPGLVGIEDGAFANVLCETVIMHLPPAGIAAAVRRMLAILSPGGTLYLSWRVTAGQDRRDPHGRLYAAFDLRLVVDALAITETLLDEEVISASSGKTIRRLVARKGGGAVNGSR